MTKKENNSSTTNTLSDFVNSVINLLHDIGSPVDTIKFDPSKTIADLSGLGICLNSEASKFALAFKPPVVAENSSACESFLNRLTQLTLICKGIPLNQGKCFRQEILEACKKVLRASICLGNSFLDKPISFEGENQKFIVGSLALDKEFLASTGILWNECEGLKNLPKSNKEAAYKRFLDVISLVDDAIYEIQELLDETQNRQEIDTTASAQDLRGAL
ncbi:hypothetical protein DSO57_1028438 [Entomophthora muscae]|uniref:Uncharacterized protein n=1 Tax=Entomophthora muscae TaxID=34485 RepID=A0ACC2TNM2_9FUNG|nr:hypothetical protein DSO57_1028438 [Entomophthora muscae]